MINRTTRWVRAAILLVILLSVARAPTSAQTDIVTDLAARVNRERVARGLAPLALNAHLTAAAQAHADDVARNGRTTSAQAGHIGSDGSNVFDRVARTQYGAYSWGRRLGENWAWYRNPADAFAMWMESASHRANILHPLFREMGIGVTAHPVVGFVYVIDFGAQPNVLPFFINAGAAETTSRQVQLTLTSEDVAPNGDGDNIGRPTQVMISNTADFAGATWQAYAPKIAWTLAPNGETPTVYIKYRDAKGRTALASASIVVRAATPTRAPTARATLLSTVIATRVPTESPTAPPTETPTLTPTPTVTPTPSETATPTPELIARATETPAPRAPASAMNEWGIAVVAVLSIVMIRVWFAVEH